MLVLNIIDNPMEFSKFGLKILETAIYNKKNNTIEFIFKKIFEIIDNNNNNYYYNYMSIISLSLPKLCDHYYSNLVMDYILHTSILLNPFCRYVRNSTNTSLCAYSNTSTSINQLTG